jgi:predicted ABC-type transport system involved in lysophospholipase L1 biosynthesis ATPase subunit
VCAAPQVLRKGVLVAPTHGQILGINGSAGARHVCCLGRVVIARAVAKRPPVLLCDERTGARESHTGIMVLEVLVRIGHRGETEVEIVSGLSPGAFIAVHPGDRVRHGVRVESR